MTKPKSVKSVAYLHPKTHELLKYYTQKLGGHMSGTIDQIVKNHLLSQPFIQSYLQNQLEETQNV
jgi:hypothetical protein